MQLSQNDLAMVADAIFAKMYLLDEENHRLRDKDGRKKENTRLLGKYNALLTEVVSSMHTDTKILFHWG